MRALLYTSVLSTTLMMACGGNWSNSDLDFINALPDREALKSKLPTTASSTSPLTGVATRHDGLLVGEPSTSYAQTSQAKHDFNGMLDNILNVVDKVRTYAPTSRTKTSRTWGPYADSTNTGFEFRVVITQVDETTFGWALESHKLGADYFAMVTGTFKPTVSLKQGQGAMVVHVKDFKTQIKVDEGLAALDQIDIVYVTDKLPSTVSMLFTFAPGNVSGLSALGYTSREQADRSGALQFLVSTPTNAQVSALELTSFWQPNGAGRSTGIVRLGEYSGATQTECWSERFLVTYFSQSWPGGITSGRESDCVSVMGF